MLWVDGVICMCARVQCDCCPRCWTCVELLSRHYDCAASNGVDVRYFDARRDRVAVGDHVLWHIGPEAARSIAHGKDGPVVADGWLQCASHPSLLRTGLRMLDNGTLVGR